MQNDNQFSLSYGLLILLQWLTEHESAKLTKIITKALNSGLREELDNAHNTQLQDPDFQESLQYSVVDFFSILETILAQQLNDQDKQKAREKNLMPALEQLDASLLDKDTVNSSLGKVATFIKDNPHENPTQLLFKELLKTWKPQKKDIAH